MILRGNAAMFFVYSVCSLCNEKNLSYIYEKNFVLFKIILG